MRATLIPLSRRAYGTLMEREAWLTLAKMGTYVLLRHSFHTRFGEIDLVLEDHRTQALVFVEVRCRRKDRSRPRIGGTGGIGGAESVDRKKITRLKRAARIFLAKYHGPAIEIRFDVMEWDGHAWTHWPNAFE